MRSNKLSTNHQFQMLVRVWKKVEVIFDPFSQQKIQIRVCFNTLRQADRKGRHND